MEESNEEKIRKIVSKWETAFFLSEAILEDYSRVVSKMEGVTPDEIKKRILKVTEEKFKKSKEKQFAIEIKS